MAQATVSPPELSPDLESRTSTFSRKRTNSLATTSRKKALKRSPSTPSKSAVSERPAQDFVSFDVSSSEGDNDKERSPERAIAEDESESENSNGNINGDREEGVEDNLTPGTADVAKSENGTLSENNVTAVSPSSAMSLRKQQRLELKAAKKERKRLRALKARLEREAARAVTNSQSGRSEQNTDGGDSYDKKDDEEGGMHSMNGTDDENRSVPPTTLPEAPIQSVESTVISTDFVSLDVSDNEENSEEDKDVIVRRQHSNLSRKFSQDQSAQPSHEVIEISSDHDEAIDLEEGEEPENPAFMQITKPLLVYPPNNVPRLRLLMEYYTNPTPEPFPHEEDRQYFAPVDPSTFIIPPLKRRKVDEDGELRDFFNRQVCSVCTTEGHAEIDCEQLICQHCNQRNNHFSHACPATKWRLQDDDGEKYLWRNPPTVHVPKNKRKVGLRTLQMWCYNCAGNHYGGDCPYSVSRNSLNKGTWSLDWVKKMGWLDDSARDEVDIRPLSSRERENERGKGGDRGFPRGGKGWDRDDRKPNNNDTTQGGQYRSRYTHSQREASPPRYRDRGADMRGGRDKDRRRSPPRPPLPREPLPPPVGHTGAGGGGRKNGPRGGGDNDGGSSGGRRGGGGGGGLADRIRMPPSSGKREWNKHRS